MAGPARPANERDILLFVDGAPAYLGALTSTGTAVNNATTATPFNATPLGPAPTPPAAGFSANLTNTLAGKTLLMQATAAGFLLPSSSATVLTVAGQTLPPAAGTTPGVGLQAGERVLVITLPTEGFMQWISLSGTASLLVWELR